MDDDDDDDDDDDRNIFAEPEFNGLWSTVKKAKELIKPEKGGPTWSALRTTNLAAAAFGVKDADVEPPVNARVCVVSDFDHLSPETPRIERFKTAEK